MDHVWIGFAAGVMATLTPSLCIAESARRKRRKYITKLKDIPAVRDDKPVGLPNYERSYATFDLSKPHLQPRGVKQ